MAFLAAAFIPLPPATSGGDPWIAVVAILAFAVVAVVALVAANLPVRPKAEETKAPRTTLPQAGWPRLGLN